MKKVPFCSSSNIHRYHSCFWIRFRRILEEDRRRRIFKCVCGILFWDSSCHKEVQESRYRSSLSGIQKRTSSTQVKHNSFVFYCERKLRHPKVIKLIGVCLSPLCMVMEYVAGGSLYKILHETKSELSYGQKLKISMDIASAIAYLHECEIIHRDIKTMNILVIFFGFVVTT